MSSEQDPAKDASFDSRLASLEGLVAELEDGSLELESAIAKYQAGIELLRSCHSTLGTYKAQIEELSAEAEVTVSKITDPDMGDSSA